MLQGGGGGAQLLDVNDFILNLPTLEYHSKSWTWFDLLMQIKKDSITALISQLVKQKINIKKGRKKAKSKDDNALHLVSGGAVEKKGFFGFGRKKSDDGKIIEESEKGGQYDLQKASLLLGKKFGTTIKKGKALIEKAVKVEEKSEKTTAQEEQDLEPENEEFDRTEIIMPRNVQRKNSFGEILSNIAGKIPGSPLFGSPAQTPKVTKHDLIGSQIQSRAGGKDDLKKLPGKLSLVKKMSQNSNLESVNNATSPATSSGSGEKFGTPKLHLEKTSPAPEQCGDESLH